MSGKYWSSDRVGVALAILAAFGFAFKAIFIKLAYALPMATPAIDPITLVSLRMLLSLPVFVWVAWRSGRGAAVLTRRDWLLLTTLGVLGYYGSSLLDFAGLQYISAGLERLVLFTYPTLTLLLAMLLHGRPLRRRELLSLLFTYAGIGLAFAHDLQFSGETRNVIVGGLLVFASSLAFALYLTGSSAMIRRLGSMRFTALAMLVSTAASMLHFVAVRPLTDYLLPSRMYGYVAGIVVVSTVLPIFMQSASIARIGAGRSALIGTIGPVLTIAFSWWLLSEPISLEQVLGTVLVLVGVVLVSRS